MDTPNVAIAALVGQLVADQQERDSLFLAWLSGTADGGPEADGNYPLPTPSGTVVAPCFALLTDPLIGAAAAAAGSASAAASSASGAQASQSDVTLKHAAILALLDEARTLRTQTMQFRQEAASEHAAARAEREACQQLKADMQALLDAWEAQNP